MSLRSLFRSKPKSGQPAQYHEIPAGPVWAVGDIHGQLDLLKALEARISETERQHENTGAAVPVVYLGDFIDRGPHSADVIDHLLAPAPKGLERHLLRGNHEEMFEAFLAAPDPNANWLDFGGEETLASYGLFAEMHSNPRHFSAAVEIHVPPAHRHFLSQLKDAVLQPAPRFAGEQILFVHAGVDPDTAMMEQDPTTLRWIREPFLSRARPNGPMVVHGHTPVDLAEQHETRINIDTGAGHGRALSAVRLDPSGEVLFVRCEP